MRREFSPSSPALARFPGSAAGTHGAATHAAAGIMVRLSTAYIARSRIKTRLVNVERVVRARRLARACVNAGAHALVAGSAVFKGGPDHYAANIAALRGQ